MSTGSDRVKRWRRKIKVNIVISMGGCCNECGYSKCTDALELHHLNPEEKEFGFGKVRANPKKAEFLIPELKKCIMLCSNCHREVHSSILDVEDGLYFDEEVFLRLLKRERKISNCQKCGKENKDHRNKTCSTECASALKSRVDWENVDLEELLLSNSGNKSAVARLLSISDSAVGKRMKKLNLE